MGFSFDAFATEVRTAAAGPDPVAATRKVLETALATPAPIIAATDPDEDETLLFEDETVSVWRCRFQPGVVMPPHEHLLDVHIGVYSGGEKNILFSLSGGRLHHEATHVVQQGEVLTLGADCIHAVSADVDVPSDALHIYHGPLTRLTRGLFDWTSGAQIDFTMENFEAMKRPASDLPAF